MQSSFTNFRQSVRRLKSTPSNTRAGEGGASRSTLAFHRDQSIFPEISSHTGLGVRPLQWPVGPGPNLSLMQDLWRTEYTGVLHSDS